MATDVTEGQIRGLAPNAHLSYVKGIPFLIEGLRLADIATPLRVAHFMAQILHESGGLRIREESFNYTADGLISTFGSKRVSRAIADRICRTPTRAADQQAIANALYGGLWGRKNLGNTLDGDGWRFRGRGPMQLTGRANYARFGEALDIDLVGKPDLALEPQYIFALPVAYWRERDCDAKADADDLEAVTRVINGGTIGIEDRAAWLKKTKAVWL